MKKKTANKKILKAVNEIQKIYLIINEIENKDEKKNYSSFISRFIR